MSSTPRGVKRPARPSGTAQPPQERGRTRRCGLDASGYAASCQVARVVHRRLPGLGRVAESPLSPRAGRGDAGVPRAARVKALAVRGPRTGLRPLQRLDPPLAQAVVGLVAGASQLSHRPDGASAPAGAVVAHGAVLRAVERVAGRQHRAPNELQVGVREGVGQTGLAVDVEPRGERRERLLVPGLGHRRPGQGETRRAGDDAVEVIEEALRGDHPLPPAVRAAVEIQILRRPPVVGGEERLAEPRDPVQRVVAVVQPGLRIEAESGHAAGVGIVVGGVVVAAVGRDHRLALQRDSGSPVGEPFPSEFGSDPSVPPPPWE